jgi:hypothetical protein
MRRFGWAGGRVGNGGKRPLVVGGRDVLLSMIFFAAVPLARILAAPLAAISCLLVLSQVLAGPVVAAETDDLITKALELRRHGDDQGALPLLQEALSKSHSPRATAQLGFCQQGLGQWAEAETQLTSALSAATTDPWIRKNRAVIESALVIIRTHIARVEVIGDPAGAAVFVNGNSVGSLPLGESVHVGAGEIEVEVRASGYKTATKSFHIDAAQYQKVVLRLEREAAAGAAAAANPAGGPAAVGSAGSDALGDGRVSSPLAPEPARPALTPARGAVKWVLWGTAAVALGVGIYGAARNSSLVHDFDAGCGIDPATGAPAPQPNVPGQTVAGCTSLKNRYETASQVGIGGFIGAGVFAVAGFVLWGLEPRAGEHHLASASCAPGLEPGLRTWMGCSFRF